jgi:hypothetical protein
VPGPSAVKPTTSRAGQHRQTLPDNRRQRRAGGRLDCLRLAPSSSGLGHHPLKVEARVRTPLGLQAGSQAGIIVGVKLEAQGPEPLRELRPKNPGLVLAVAVSNNVISKTLKRTVGELPVHPFIKCVMHEQIG